MPVSVRAFLIGWALAAFALVQADVQACAQDSSVAMYTKAPPLSSGDQAVSLTAPMPGNGVGGAMMPVPQLPPAVTHGDVTVAGTGLDVTNGYSSRAVAETAANWYYSSFGLHVDAAREWREEDASFFVAGVSYAITPYIRPKFLYGTSSENLSIQPKTYLRGEIEFQPPPAPGSTGIVATPSVTYREYRNGVQEVVPELHIAFYHPEFADHTYFVTEVKATTTFVESVSAVGSEFSGTATYVMPKWGTVGAELFGGRMTYDATLCVELCGVRNRFAGVRPLVSFYLNHTDSLELYVRGEIVATDSYNIYGGTVGLKTAF